MMGSMGARYFRQWLYAVMLLLVALAMLISHPQGLSPLPSPLIWAAGLISFLLVWHMGVPAPLLGLISMERIPQLTLLFVLGPVSAALINASAALVFPFTSQAYSQGSKLIAALRALHNAAMVTIMMLTAGWIHESLGGRFPLEAIDGVEMGRLLVVVAMLQLINTLALVAFYRLDGRDAKRLFTPLYMLGDFLFVPAGILGALLLNQAHIEAYWLWLVTLLTILIVFNHLQRQRAQQSDPVPAVFQGAVGPTERRLDTVTEQWLEACRALFRFDEIYLVLVNPAQTHLDFLLHCRGDERLGRRAKTIERGLFGHVALSREELLVSDWGRAEPEIRQMAEETGQVIGAAMFVPVVSEGQVVAVSSVQSVQPRAFTPADLNLFKTLAGQFARALADACAFEELNEHRQRLEELVAARTQELESANLEKERLLEQLGTRSAELEKQVRLDPLTGLANRRELNDRLAGEIRRARERQDRSVSIVMADIDHFKSINDRYGHPVGDAVLKKAAELLLGCCGDDDTVARYGGEEFAVVLSGVDLTTAARVAEAIRETFAEAQWKELHPELAVTLSLGVAQWQPGQDDSALCSAADIKLYRAKRAGRNRVMV